MLNLIIIYFMGEKLNLKKGGVGNSESIKLSLLCKGLRCLNLCIFSTKRPFHLSVAYPLHKK